MRFEERVPVRNDEAVAPCHSLSLVRCTAELLARADVLEHADRDRNVERFVREIVHVTRVDLEVTEVRVPDPDVVWVEQVDADDLVRLVVGGDRAPTRAAAEVQDPICRLQVEDAGDRSYRFLRSPAVLKRRRNRIIAIVIVAFEARSASGIICVFPVPGPLSTSASRRLRGSRFSR